MNKETEAFLNDDAPAAATVTVTPTQEPSQIVDVGPDRDDVIIQLLGTDAGSETVASSNKLSEMLAARQFNYSVHPEPVREVYTCAGVPIATPGNLVAITAQAKSGKSAVISAMMSSAMTDDSTIDALGFGSANPDGWGIIHIDTEQSPFDHWCLVARAIKRAGLNAAPEWLRSYCLTGLSIADTNAALELLLAETAAKFGGVHSVFVDGTADLCNNVNDPEEANGLVAKLHALAIKYQCPIINVLHLNPGSNEKSRGHLGSQLERKAETNLVIEKVMDVSQLSSTKQRRAPILPGQGPRFKWSDEKKMHVSTNESLPTPTKTKRVAVTSKSASTTTETQTDGEPF